MSLNSAASLPTNPQSNRPANGQSMMPMMVNIRRAVVFGGDRGEGLQKAEKIAFFTPDLLIVPEGNSAPAEFVFGPGRETWLHEDLLLAEDLVVPVAPRRASLRNYKKYIRGRDFVCSDLRNPELNAAISAYCRRKGILCNIVDVKDLCSVWFMSVVHQPKLVVGLSSNGGCAYYARKMREELTEEFKQRSGMSEVLTVLRNELAEKIRPSSAKIPILDKVYYNDEFRSLVAAGSLDQALALGRQIAGLVPGDFPPTGADSGKGGAGSKTPATSNKSTGAAE